MFWQKRPIHTYSVQQIMDEYINYVVGRAKIYNNKTLSLNMQRTELHKLELSYPHETVEGWEVDAGRINYIRKRYTTFQDTLSFECAYNDMSAHFININHRNYTCFFSIGSKGIKRRSTSFSDLVPGDLVYVTGIVALDDESIVKSYGSNHLHLTLEKCRFEKIPLEYS